MAKKWEENIDVLIRGIPGFLHFQMKTWANQHHLSTNQALIQVLEKGWESLQKDEIEKKERKELFERIEQIREKMFRDYGKMKDSTQYIREDRDSR